MKEKGFFDKQTIIWISIVLVVLAIGIIFLCKYHHACTYKTEFSGTIIKKERVFDQSEGHESLYLIMYCDRGFNVSVRVSPMTYTLRNIGDKVSYKLSETKHNPYAEPVKDYQLILALICFSFVIAVLIYFFIDELCD